VLLLEHVLPLGVVVGGGLMLLGQDLVGLGERRRVDVAEGHHLGVRRIGLLEEHPALAADADEADPHGSALHGPPHRGARAQGGGARRPREGLEEVAPAQLLLLGGQVHEVAPWARTLAAPSRRKRSRPAIRPVRKWSRTSPAPASIRFLFTNRYAP